MITWLASELRAAGLKVHEMAGWKTRQTRNGFAPVGVVAHHTATSVAWSDTAVAALLRDGRRDLAGPLSQCGLERDGTWVMVAAGRCNHNGFGTWGNDSIGVEAYNDGRGEPWPKVQLDAYTRGVAVICAHYSWGAHRVKGHKETDPDRKIDPTGIDMARFRRTVATILAPPLPPPPETDDMAVLAKKTGRTEWWLTDGITKRHITDRAEAAQLVYAGFAKWDDGAPFVGTYDAFIDRAVTVSK
jgi:hypothetical protein